LIGVVISIGEVSDALIGSSIDLTPENTGQPRDKSAVR
jgi:hypothetical protein